MSKYTEEFKLKVVKYCLEENYSQKEAEKNFSIPKKSGIKIWIRKYQEHGIEGLVKKQKSSYSGKYKKYVVEYMQSNHLSVTEVAVHFNLGSGSVVSKWERIYYERGPQGLSSKQRGRPKNMKLKLERKLDKEIEGKNQARGQEKVIVVDELRQKYSLRELLKLAEIPRSTFYYH